MSSKVVENAAEVGTQHKLVEDLTTVVSFWDALTPPQKDEFMAGARRRSYASGEQLMQEGEAADHVAVILIGHTKICVDEGGQERIIAYRGPGQLIGERAALEVTVRSATVVAMDTVKALTMQTGDFVSFLSAHPEVLKIVENEVYSRLTEEPVRPDRSGHDDAAESRLAEAGRPETPLPTRIGSLAGENCTIVFTDVVSFSSPNRDDNDRLHIRHELAMMTSAALRLIWDDCICEDRGDGFLVIAPPSVPTTDVLEYLLLALPIALKRHNASGGASTHFKLRVALDVGAVTSDEMGVSGQMIINAARLLDAPALKKAISGGQAELGLICSDFVFQNTVKHAKGVTDPAGFQRVRVKVKETSSHGWMSLIGSPIQMPPRRAALLSA